jgi:sortase A
MKAARRAWLTIAALLFAIGAWQVGRAAWIHAKGSVAQRLIAAAWADGRDAGAVRRPWPGADLRPIARIRVPQRNIELYVLDNASPRALAFGPAHVGGTAMPASAGNTVIVAHRDTHFAFLRELRVDEEIEVEASRGARARYRVRDVAVVDQGESRVLDPADSSQLTLVTCFPFDAVLPGTRLRYVVIADRIA